MKLSPHPAFGSRPAGVRTPASPVTPSATAKARSRRSSAVIRFHRTAVDAAVKVAAEGEDTLLNAWIALDSLINRKNRELSLCGTAPLRTPSLRHFARLVERWAGVGENGSAHALGDFAGSSLDETVWSDD